MGFLAKPRLAHLYTSSSHGSGIAPRWAGSADGSVLCIAPGIARDAWCFPVGTWWGFASLHVGCFACTHQFGRKNTLSLSQCPARTPRPQVQIFNAQPCHITLFSSQISSRHRCDADLLGTSQLNTSVSSARPVWLVCLKMWYIPK
jgi:hypothetical protein